MKKNMGTVDRLIRIGFAMGIAVLYFTGRINGTAAVILGVVGLVLLLTSLVGWCPAYVPLGFGTRKRSGGSPRG